MGFNFLIWVEIGRQGTLAAHHPFKGRVCRLLFGQLGLPAGSVPTMETKNS